MEGNVQQQEERAAPVEEQGERKVSSGNLPRVSVERFPEGTPWWAKLAVNVITWIGFPAAVCAFLLWERVTILKEFSNTISTQNKVMERIVPIMDKLEKKLPQ